jgi:hypothetical protein
MQKPSVELSLLLNIHEDSLLNNVVGGIGGLNITPHMVNPLMNLLLVFDPCFISMVNLKPNLGV